LSGAVKLERTTVGCAGRRRTEVIELDRSPRDQERHWTVEFAGGRRDAVRRLTRHCAVTRELRPLERCAEQPCDHPVLNLSCPRTGARIDEQGDSDSATLCVRVDLGGEVVARPATAVTVVPTVQ
jgi:hypothetical protein